MEEKKKEEFAPIEPQQGETTEGSTKDSKEPEQKDYIDFHIRLWKNTKPYQFERLSPQLEFTDVLMIFDAIEVLKDVVVKQHIMPKLQKIINPGNITQGLKNNPGMKKLFRR